MSLYDLLALVTGSVTLLLHIILSAIVVRCFQRTPNHFRGIALAGRGVDLERRTRTRWMTVVLLSFVLTASATFYPYGPYSATHFVVTTLGTCVFVWAALLPGLGYIRRLTGSYELRYGQVYRLRTRMQR